MRVLRMLSLASVALLVLLPAPSHGWFWQKSPTADTTGTRDSRSPKAVRTTYLDTLNRGKEVAITDRDIVVVTPAVSVQKPPPPAGQSAPQPAGVRDGFRVQCLATSEIEKARAQKRVAESIVAYPAYVVFEEPFYKLLVGDFVKRSDAEKALSELRRGGFPDAWIAAGKVTPQR